MLTSVLLIPLALPDLVQDSYLLHHRVVQLHDILTLDVCASILFEDLELVADV